MATVKTFFFAPRSSWIRLTEFIVEIAIARNTANATAVKSVSQANARGYLNALKQSIEQNLPGESLQTTETDTEGLNTQSVLQYAETPYAKISSSATRIRPKNFAYKQGGKCLTDFSNWARNRESDENATKLHDFIVEIAPVAVKEYRRWEAHDGWNGHRLHERGKSGDKPLGGRPVRRTRAGKVNWVAPGVLFPVMSALSAFVEQDRRRWTLKKPELFKEEELIRRAVQQIRALDREVTVMGRSEAAYDALSIYTETIASVLASASRQAVVKLGGYCVAIQ